MKFPRKKKLFFLVYRSLNFEENKKQKFCLKSWNFLEKKKKFWFKKVEISLKKIKKKKFLKLKFRWKKKKFFFWLKKVEISLKKKKNFFGHKSWNFVVTKIKNFLSKTWNF